ncbi:N-formylglutamate amidohydrolase [Hoeflea sp.]|uniref:N-formylglutamate amidohydrolase n=1 Tax=Hoeflea sp. TaxID=1940281 RepID=UPI003B02A886
MKNYFHMLLDEPNALTPDQVVAVHNEAGDHRLVLVCEHASNWIPPAYEALGLDETARQSHAAWDPGALGVAVNLSRSLNAPLVAGCVSRLVYDCNRSPQAADAIPAVSEIFDVPGNTGLTEEAREERTALIYRPFTQRLGAVLGDGSQETVIVTIHSFTPVYHGQPRTTEIGILHGEDPRLAAHMLALAGQFTRHCTRLNDPYGPQDGVSHTLNLHGARNGLANVMIEIRNDLIDTQQKQAQIAAILGPWLEAAIAVLKKEATS